MTAPELTKVNKILHRMVSGTNFKAVLTMSNYSIQKRPPEVFCKKAVLKKFAKFTEKHLCFSVNFGKFLRTPFLKERRQWLLLSV